LLAFKEMFVHLVNARIMEHIFTDHQPLGITLALSIVITFLSKKVGVKIVHFGNRKALRLQAKKHSLSRAQ
jgi:hypothetical protein